MRERCSQVCASHPDVLLQCQAGCVCELCCVLFLMCDAPYYAHEGGQEILKEGSISPPHCGLSTFIIDQMT